MGVLELYGAGLAEGGVPPAAVVEAFDVLEDRVCELDTGVPAPPVQYLDLQASPEGFDDGVVVRVADRIRARATGRLAALGR